MRWSTSSAGCLLLALSTLAAQPGHAATLQGGSVEIVIDQKEAPGQWIVVDSDSQSTRKGRLGDDVALMLDPARNARFAVINGIPALFDYSLVLKDPVPTENFTTAIAFLEKLAPLGAVAPSAGDEAKAADKANAVAKAPAGPVEVCVVYADVDLCEFRKWTERLRTFKENASKALTSAIHADTSAVEIWKGTLRDAIAELRRIEKALDKIDEADMAGSLDPGKAPWSIWEQRAPASPALLVRGQGPLSDLVAWDRVRSGDLRSGKPLVDTAIAVVRRRGDTKAAIQYAADFSDAYQDTFKRQDLGKPGEPITYNAANDLPAEVTVAANKRFADVFPPGTDVYQGERVGTYKIAIKPRERLSLKPGAGVLYSFVRDPQFSVAEDDAGQLTIAKKEDDYAKFEGAVTLNITSADWQLFGVHPFIQVGIAPSSDNLAILAGVGLQLFDKGALSLGAIYQRVERLAPDLAEGDVIDDPEKLKTEHEFKTGLYLMLSVQL